MAFPVAEHGPIDDYYALNVDGESASACYYSLAAERSWREDSGLCIFPTAEGDKLAFQYDAWTEPPAAEADVSPLETGLLDAAGSGCVASPMPESVVVSAQEVR